MILVTGGTGLVGSHLLHALLTRGETIRATKRSTSNLVDIELAFSFYQDDSIAQLKNVEWVECDLLNPMEVDDLMEGVDRVFHCAAAVSFNPKNEKKLMEINPAITANLVNAALEHHVKHFAHVSSVAAIGRTQGNEEFITEQTEWKNGPDNSKYAIGKYLAELEVWRGIEEGLKAAMINPTVILGAGNWKHTSNTLFRKFSKPNPFYTKGGNGFVDVRDVVKALLAVSDSTISGERFITVGENVSYLNLITYFADAFDVEPPKTVVKSWMMEIAWRIEKWRSALTGKAPLLTKETARTSQNSWKYSNKKAKNQLGLKFTPVRESVATYADFYKRLF